MYMDILLGNHTVSFLKGTYYRFMNSVHANWIRFISLLASRISTNVNEPATSAERVNAQIVDDSFFSRGCSIKVKLLIKVFDHVNLAFLYGFRIITLGWTDGNKFLPFNHVLLSFANKSQYYNENGTNCRCNGYRRRELALSRNTEAMIELISEARKALLPADYVLFHNWFAPPKTLTAVKALGYVVIAMIKMLDKMTFNCKASKHSLKEIYRMNKKRCKRSEYLLSVTVDVEKNRPVIPAKVAYVKTAPTERIISASFQQAMKLTSKKSSESTQSVDRSKCPSRYARAT